MKNEIYEHMLAYLEKGFSLIPIGIDKKPLIPTWKEYQSRKPTGDEITLWCDTLNPVGIGIVTGKISGVAVLDIDVGAETKGLNLPPTPSVRTGGGGWHHYFKYPSGAPLQCSNGFRHKMDFKAEGGYVIAPPSSHKSGKQYEWLVTLEEIDLAEVPDWLRQEVVSKGASQKDWTKITAGVGKGERNESAATYIGKLLHGLPETDWESVGWGSAVAWNDKNVPPLAEKELRGVFDSIATAENNQRTKDDKEDGSHASRIIKEILSGDVFLFHDQSRDGYIAPENNGAEIVKLKSKQFSRWIAKISWQKFGKPIRSEDIRTVLGTLEGIAIFDKDQYTLHVRTAFHDNAIWYDLGKSVVKITRDRWEVINDPPILFRRYPHQQPQVLPLRGGCMSQILDFVNIKNEQERLLIQAWCVAGIIPGFPHPFSTFHGPQGSGKSTTVSVLKQLLDPSQIKLSSPPDNVREFIQLGSHHWFLPIDNLSSLSEWLSDALCRACTGEGFSKRELYSDDDDVVYSFQNMGSLNGINLVVERPDLLERCIIFGLEKFEQVENMTSFNRRFNEVRPLILGAMFDTVSKALQRIDDVPQENRFRMSDFARWGCTIAEVLGYTATDFTNAYKSNIKLQHQEAIDASPIAQAIELLMKDRNEWNGTPTELHRLLEKLAEDEHIDKKSDTWPKAANWMWRRIMPIATNLRERGIKVDRTSGDERIISFVKVTENAVDAVSVVCGDENTTTTADSMASDAVENADGGISQETLDIQQHDSTDSIS